MPSDGAMGCVGVEEEKGVLLPEETPCQINLDATLFLGDEVEESISHWTLNSSLYSIHFLYSMCHMMASEDMLVQK